jgi:two-component system response regulator FixJ
MSHHRTVYVIDCDRDTRRSLTGHLSVIGAEAWPFASGGELLAMLEHLIPACILLDLDMTDPSGLSLLRELGERRPDCPVVAMSAREEVALAVGAMKLGALDFLSKSVGPAALAAALAPAWDILVRAKGESEVRRAAQERVASLTAREVDILMSLIDGQPNKQVAHELGISVRTVEMHRAHIMAKLAARNLAEAAVLATQAGLVGANGPFSPDGEFGSPSGYASDPRTRFTSRRLSSRIANA